MFFKQCNINKTDRINRTVIGAMLVIAALVGMSKVFFIIVGVVLMFEGLIGWCTIPWIIGKMKGEKS